MSRGRRVQERSTLHRLSRPAFHVRSLETAQCGFAYCALSSELGFPGQWMALTTSSTVARTANSLIGFEPMATVSA
jgi:hypothetical protein